MAEIHCREKGQKLHWHLVVIANKGSDRLDKQHIKAKKIQTCRYDDRTFKVIHSAEQIPLQRLQ